MREVIRTYSGVILIVLTLVSLLVVCTVAILYVKYSRSWCRRRRTTKRRLHGSGIVVVRASNEKRRAASTITSLESNNTGGIATTTLVANEINEESYHATLLPYTPTKQQQRLFVSVRRLGADDSKHFPSVLTTTTTTNTNANFMSNNMSNNSSSNSSHSGSDTAAEDSRSSLFTTTDAEETSRTAATTVTPVTARFIPDTSINIYYC